MYSQIIKYSSESWTFFIL